MLKQIKRIIEGIEVEGTQEEWDNFDKSLQENKSFKDNYRLSEGGFYLEKIVYCSGIFLIAIINKVTWLVTY